MNLTKQYQERQEAKRLRNRISSFDKDSKAEKPYCMVTGSESRVVYLHSLCSLSSFRCHLQVLIFPRGL
ncbi:MAG: hypothetical protein KKH60_00495 [Proteobacteria bacterium]|nr:hypothetical protein [Pseudomonadota bacterium]